MITIFHNSVLLYSFSSCVPTLQNRSNDCKPNGYMDYAFPKSCSNFFILFLRLFCTYAYMHKNFDRRFI